MKQLRHKGRYFIALSAFEYVAQQVPTSSPTYASGIRWLLTAPPDTIYPDSAPIIVDDEGNLHTADSTLLLTVNDLNFTGAYHDLLTNKRSRSASNEESAAAGT